jgi:hypothetical protein
MSEKYMQWVELQTEISEDKKLISAKSNQLIDMEEDLTSHKDSGMYPTKITDHAMTQISDRLENLAHDSKPAYKDIINKSAKHSMLLPSNLRNFILTMVAKSIELGAYKSKKSRSGGTEYIYSVKMSKWEVDRSITFTLIVENSVVKTGYFNYDS